jgi:penicillin-binding protein 1A
MYDPFNNVSPEDKHPANALRRRLADALAPARRGWLAFTEPVRRLTAPLRENWRTQTAPIRAAWGRFAQRQPLAAGVLGWSARIVKWGVYLLLALIVGVGIGLFGPLPSREELRSIETANASEVYTMDSVLIGRFYIENRTAVGLKNVSPHVVDALIATEDRRFFEHHGIDVMSWFRVGYGMLIGKDELGGGSTLSQQLAKNLFGRRDYKVPGLSLVINKIRENFVSARLERIYTKDQLLDLYLNTVPFGGDIYGINIASKQYFNKPPKDLTADQAATLIGMLKATSKYHPVRNPENSRKRRNVVLLQMVRNGDLTQEQYREISEKPVNAKYYSRSAHIEGTGTYFREYLRTEVMPRLLREHTKKDGTSYNLYTDGLKIYTTLHSKMQRYAEEAVQQHMSQLQQEFNDHWKGAKEKPWGDDKWIDEQMRRSDRWSNLKESGMDVKEIVAEFQKPVPMTIFSWKKGGIETDTTMSPLDSVRYYFMMLNCGFMAMDHRNGYVRAWVGGTNFKYFKYDHILSRRQVGSTFKPIIYSAALRDSIMPCDFFRNRIVRVEDWEPHNADEDYGGWYSVVGALTNSVNVVAAQVIEKIGIQKSMDQARAMGITSTMPREYGISLGAADISLYEMMRVYGTIANHGKRPEPVMVLNISTRGGEVVYDYKQELAKNPRAGAYLAALTPDQATIMTKMLQNVIEQGTGARLRHKFKIPGDFAGKTGTTQNQSDGWFICFNPQLVTGAWVGAPSRAVRFRSLHLGQGAHMALPIVAWFWHKVANDRKLGRLLQEKFPEPDPKINALFNCYPRIWYNPYYTPSDDSLYRDSMGNIYPVVNQNSGDGPPDPEKAAKEAEEAKNRQERKEKRDNFFKKLFNHNPDEEKEKEKKKTGGG